MITQPGNNGRSILFGCVNVVMGALAMVATLPGRTHGLGLVTEPLLKDLGLDRGDYAQINLWATLLGALACVPAGKLIDRWGTRHTAVLVTATLGLTVWGMSRVTTATELFLLVLVTRALGQSALSVVSISIVGKWFTRRSGVAMAIYSVLIGLMFAGAFGLVGWAVRDWGWREAWGSIGIALLVGCAPLFALLVRSAPATDASVEQPAAEELRDSYLLGEALRTPAFWIFAGATSLYGLVSSGMGLFNQAILEERGFDAKTYHNLLVYSSLIGLVSQLICGGLALKWPLHRLMAVAMLVYAGSLVWLPQVETQADLVAYVLMMGSAGGVVTVVFFAIWGQAFGRSNLGRIQGAAQMLTVVSSAVGPIVFAECFQRTGSYTPLFYMLALPVLCLGLAAGWAPMPVKKAPQAVAKMAVVS